MSSTTPMTQEELLAIHDEMTREAKEIMVRKNDDYADPGDADVFGNLDACEHLAICSCEEGILSCVLDKVKRLVTSCNRELRVNDEAAKDTRRDIIKYSMSTEQKLEKYLNGDEAPPMFLFGAHVPPVVLSELGPDGLKPDTLLPELPLKRIMAGGISQKQFRPVKAGDVLILQRTLVDIFEKQGKTGPLIFVVYEIDAKTEDGEPVMQQTQSRIVR